MTRPAGLTTSASWSSQNFCNFPPPTGVCQVGGSPWRKGRHESGSRPRWRRRRRIRASRRGKHLSNERVLQGHRLGQTDGDVLRRKRVARCVASLAKFPSRFQHRAPDGHGRPLRRREMPVRGWFEFSAFHHGPERRSGARILLCRAFTRRSPCLTKARGPVGSI